MSMKIGAKIGVWIVAVFCFFSANGQQTNDLSGKEQSLVIISSLTATGNLEKLKVELSNGLDAGLTINEIKEALVQLYAYCGFPRSLNAINTFRAILDERKSRGIQDIEGREILLESYSGDNYERGRKVLEELTKTSQLKPAPGFGEFAPRIDAFLKEHLFADIFGSDVLNYRHRELVTISALASMEGVEGQLQSHINVGKNVGITESELVMIADLIEKTINKTQANTIRKIIGKEIQSILDSDMMVRIAEVEVYAEYLEKYIAILKEEAAASIKVEDGVISIFPFFKESEPTKISILEIYANKEVYQSHLKTPHFVYYKEATSKMVKSLKLNDVSSLDPTMLNEVFKKIK